MRHLPKHPVIQASEVDTGAGGGLIVLTPPANDSVQSYDFTANRVLTCTRRQDPFNLMANPLQSAVGNPHLRYGFTSLSPGAFNLGYAQDSYSCPAQHDIECCVPHSGLHDRVLPSACHLLPGVV
jgi:hypothetical protein